MSAEVDWELVRSEFPAASEQVYLNTATFGPPPRVATEAVETALRSWSTGRGNWRDWEGAGERARQALGQILDTEASNIALVPAVSVAAGQVAATLEPKPRANIVVGGGEFRSNLFPWLVQEERGFELRSVPFKEGRFDLDDLVAAIDSNTCLVAVSSVQSSNGFRLPLESVAQRCSEVDARLFVDGTQSVGALRLPLDCADFVAIAGYKWLLAPRGANFLYVAPEHVDGMSPVFAGWKSPANPHAEYYGGPLELAPDASRFDVSIAWLPWVGAAASLECSAKIGIDAIEARDMELARAFREGLPARGLAPLFEEKESSPIVSLEVPDPEGLAVRLGNRGISAAVRGPYLRASFHLFNDAGDVERALQALV